MRKTVGEMKVGERLYLGMYGITNDEHPRIAWLKASPNCDFISELVLDCISFDEREIGRPDHGDSEFFYGNPRFAQSNINQFLNSEEEDWWSKKTEFNRKPGALNGEHFGFLYWFSSYEVESIVQKRYEVDGVEVVSKVRLPMASEIIGNERLQLFKRKGVRAKAAPQPDYFWRYYGISDRSFVEFRCMDRRSNESYAVSVINKMGYADYRYPYQHSGLRPMCTLKPDIIVTDENGRGEPLNGYEVVPFRVAQTPVFSDDELINLLGVAPP